MNLPANNPAGWEKGSPLSFAHQLQGNLLIIHGTGDDSVHCQNQEVLINALAKANKPFSANPFWPAPRRARIDEERGLKNFSGRPSNIFFDNSAWGV